MNKERNPPFTFPPILLLHSPHLEDRVHDVASNSGTRSENSRVTQLLSKFLAHRTGLATSLTLLLLLLLWLLGNSHRRDVSIIRILLLRWGWVSAICGLHRATTINGTDSLFIHVTTVIVVRGKNLDIGLGEDTLLTGPFVPTHPPVGIHVLEDEHDVGPLKRAVAAVGGGVPVQGPGTRDDGFGRRWRGGTIPVR